MPQSPISLAAKKVFPPIVLKISPDNPLFDKVTGVALEKSKDPAVVVGHILKQFFDNLDQDINKPKIIKGKELDGDQIDDQAMIKSKVGKQLLRFLNILEKKSDEDLAEEKLKDLVDAIKKMMDAIGFGAEEKTAVTFVNLTMAVMNRNNKIADRMRLESKDIIDAEAEEI